MKRVYMTPQIEFDDFQLSENIAKCEFISSNQADYECPVLMDEESGWTVFNTSINDGCSSDFAYDGNMCYELPIESGNVFFS